MYHCSPLAGEKYYLQILLTVVPRLQSYEDLQTVDKELFSMFQAACHAQRLLEDNQKWIRYFTEVVTFSTRHSFTDFIWSCFSTWTSDRRSVIMESVFQIFM